MTAQFIERPNSEPECLTVRLDFVASRGSGHTPSRKRPEYWGGDIPWISLADTPRLNHGLVHTSAKTITTAGITHSSAVIHPAGTVILLRGSSVGKSAIMASDMAVSQDYVTWTCGPEIDNWYLYYLLQSSSAEFSRIAFGNTIKTIGLQYFQNLQIRLPTIGEQQAIAATLLEVDSLISTTTRLIDKKRAIQKGQMQSLIPGRSRLAGFDKEWRLRRVAEMGAVTAGKALNVGGAGTMRPYLRTKNVLDGQIDTSEVSEMPMTDTEFARFSLEHGDVLLNEGQSLELVGRCSIYSGEFGAACAIQNHLLRFRAFSWTSPGYAAQLFRHCQSSGIFASIATKTTSIASLGRSRFAKLQLTWPSDRREQAAIAEVLDNADREISVLESRLTKARAIKQGMMEQLLTGRVRLPVDAAS